MLGGVSRGRLSPHPAGWRQCLVTRYTFNRVCTAHSSCHNDRTFSKPRRRNCRNPRLSLICPNTVSTEHSRFRYRSRHQGSSTNIASSQKWKLPNPVGHSSSRYLPNRMMNGWSSAGTCPSTFHLWSSSSSLDQPTKMVRY